MARTPAVPRVGGAAAAKRSRRLDAEPQRPLGLVGLWLGQLSTATSQGVRYGHGAGVQVNVLPTETEGFSLAQTDRYGDGEERRPHGSLGGLTPEEYRLAKGAPIPAGGEIGRVRLT